jgi:hypothetical protein
MPGAQFLAKKTKQPTINRSMGPQAEYGSCP